MAKSLFKLPFGKHKGEGIEDVPLNYLEWLMEQDWFLEKYPEGEKAVNDEIAYRIKFEMKETEIDKNWNRR